MGAGLLKSVLTRGTAGAESLVRDGLTPVSTQGRPQAGDVCTGRRTVGREVGRYRSADPGEPRKVFVFYSRCGQKPSGGFKQDSSPLGALGSC